MCRTNVFWAFTLSMSPWNRAVNVFIFKNSLFKYAGRCVRTVMVSDGPCTPICCKHDVTATFLAGRKTAVCSADASVAAGRSQTKREEEWHPYTACGLPVPWASHVSPLTSSCCHCWRSAAIFYTGHTCRFRSLSRWSLAEITPWDPGPQYTCNGSGERYTSGCADMQVRECGHRVATRHIHGWSAVVNCFYFFFGHTRVCDLKGRGETVIFNCWYLIYIYMKLTQKSLMWGVTSNGIPIARLLYLTSVNVFS